MLIATDPLSLFFMIAFLLGLVFFLLLGLLGNLGHGPISHLGGAHVSGPHIHLHPGAVHGPTHAAGHLPAHTTGQAPAHTTNANRTADQMAGHSQGLSFLSYLNPTSIFLFLFGFGLFGYLFHNIAHFIVLITMVAAAISGLVLTIVIFSILERLFGDSEGTTIQDVSDRTGLIGKVSITIPADSLGEIIYVSPGGMRKPIPARSLHRDRIERDQEVVVVSYQRGIAEVDSWDHFMNEDQAGAPTNVHMDELDQLRTLLHDSEQKNFTDNPIVMQQDTHKE